eukprot:CAMPEP_0206447592 /NCGR_PEP_ID=MMETSP0324_2-20121206/16906_1 /ASSEMBLY_ACC=CAM_ASM_000836 /TAXON_ID=2866 /ORGANISM="Crypthecodinium cohnii, Strain Seligo" /LENGTH=42 /DNA_ID= /DNA_START= /DNA_END= /DNA_ORIENTATION=
MSLSLFAYASVGAGAFEVVELFAPSSERPALLKAAESLPKLA